MKILQSPVVAAFGGATVILLSEYLPLASASHSEIYHLWGPLSSILVPLLLSIAAIWLLLALLLIWAGRRRWATRLVYPALGFSLAWVLLKQVYWLLSDRRLPELASLIFMIVMIAVVGILLAARRKRSDVLDRVVRFELTVLCFVAIFCAFQMTKMLVISWEARDLNRPRPLHQATSHKPHNRILWVVMDALSYQQVYGHRFPGLELPEFDRLAQRSTIFTQAEATATYTEIALPALMTGLPVESIQPSASGAELMLAEGTGKPRQKLDQHHTVFQDALNHGYSTGVAGWFNPYCRILPQVLDRCFWVLRMDEPGGMTPGASVFSNEGQLFGSHIARFLRLLHLLPEASTPATDLVEHQADYASLVAAGDNLLRDPSIDFVFLHLPIPHPQGIYSRKTASMATTPTTYLDNLALGDVYLAHLRQLLEEQGSWDSTTLVLMGDHSWRTWLWSGSEDWTSTEEAASGGGVFDDRPLYLVKLPHQNAPVRIDAPYSALRTRKLFDALMAGNIATPQQLAEWAAH